MATQKERMEFIATLAHHTGNSPYEGYGTFANGNTFPRTARLIMRHAATYHRLQEWQGSYPGWGEAQEAQEARIEQRIAGLAHSIGCGVHFQGDPRGCTVKLLLPDGYKDDFGGVGFCVPTA